MWNNPDMLIVIAAGNAGTDADSNGEVDDDSLNAPGTAKNVLTVGASEGVRGDSYPCDTGLVGCGGANSIFTYGSVWPTDFSVNPLASDPSAGNAEQMAAFSSRGPTDDGRIKPDVVAPGTWILSTYSDLYQEGYDVGVNPQNGFFQYDGWGYPLDEYYKYMGGTSMATPLVAGTAALVRQFYDQSEGHEASAALVKATLINSAVDLLDENGDDVDDNFYPIPNNHEGWGRVNADEATDGDHVFSDRLLIATSETISIDIEVPGGSPFKITVVWTDYPSTGAAATNLVHDIDLVVDDPGAANTYLGNVFSGGWSTIGGLIDVLNNVENVYIPTATAGTWTIDLIGSAVPFGPQPLALVVHGGTFADSEPPTWPGGAVLTQTGATPSSVTVDWSANEASDNKAVVAYDVNLDGVYNQTVVGASSAVIDGLEDSTNYGVGVSARDAAGNTASLSTVTTTTGNRPHLA